MVIVSPSADQVPELEVHFGCQGSTAAASPGKQASTPPVEGNLSTGVPTLAGDWALHAPAACCGAKSARHGADLRCCAAALRASRAKIAGMQQPPVAAAPRRPRVGMGVIVQSADGHICLGRRINSLGHGEWALPGGHLEYGESFVDCAVREVRHHAKRGGRLSLFCCNWVLPPSSGAGMASSVAVRLGAGARARRQAAPLGSRMANGAIVVALKLAPSRP